jgi:hypothetical protein
MFYEPMAGAGAAVDRIRIGMPLQLSYLDVPDEDVTLWQWQAAS